MSEGNLLPVHCCCNPQTRLGWIAVPARSQRVGERLSFIIRPAHTLLRRPDDSVEHIAAERIDTEVAELVTPPADGNRDAPDYEWTRTLAVKSAHHPIETWQRVPGFISESMMVRLHDAFLAAAKQGGVLEGG